MSQLSHNPISRRAFLRGLAATTAGSALLAACVPATAPSSETSAAPAATAGESSGASGGTVNLGISRSLALGEEDPWFTHSSLMCWEPLIGLDDKLNPKPVLAESWELSTDGLEWTFVLRQGVHFTDGEPFNAAAVVANINRNIQISPRTSNFFTMNAPIVYGDLATVEAVDEYTVRFRHHSPFPMMEATMSNFFSAMFSPRSLTPEGNFNGIPATTGPFKLVEWELGQWYRLARNDDYWGTPAKVAAINFQQIPDANTRVAALEAGQVDALVELGAIGLPQADALRGRTDIIVQADPIALTQWLCFNCGRTPFSDVRLRQAVVAAIDCNYVAQELAFGFGEAKTGVLSHLSERWFSPKGIVAYDPEKAAQLAQEALGGQRVTAKLPFNPNPTDARTPRELPEYLQSILTPLGIDIELVAVEQAVLSDLTNQGEWDLRLPNGQGWANGDPDFRFRPVLHSTGSYSTSAKGGYSNPELDALIDAAVLERDYTTRYTLCEEIQAISTVEVPAIAIYDSISPYAFRNNIKHLTQRVNYQPTIELMEIG